MKLTHAPVILVIWSLLSCLPVGVAPASELAFRQLQASGDEAPTATDADPAPSDGKVCFRAQGCPKCDWAILLGFSMASSPEYCGEGPYVSGELGLLRNVSRTVGVGGTMFYGGDDCGGRVGVRSHLRLWLHPQIGLDFGPGIVFGGDGWTNAYEWPSFTGQVSLELAGLVAPFYQFDLLRSSQTSRWDSFAGVRMESYVAPISVAILMVAIIGTWNSY